jgi:hypothetical protein
MGSTKLLSKVLEALFKERGMWKNQKKMFQVGIRKTSKAEESAARKLARKDCGMI